MMKAIEKFWFQPYTPIIFLLLLAFLIVRFGYPAFQEAIRTDDTAQRLPITPTPQVLGDDTSIINAVAKLFRLPSDEKPQIITISNIDQFIDQPFFKDAKNGDIVLLYKNNKKVILFDPIANIILDTAPIGVPTETIEPSPTTSPPTPTPKRARGKEATPTVTPASN